MAGNVVNYNANPSAIYFHESARRVKALMGPVGSGKSLAWMMQIVMRAAHLPVPLRAIVIRQSWPELRDSTKVTWDKWLGAISDWRQIDHQMRFTLRSTDGVTRTHTLDFRHARNANDASRFLSTEYGLIVLEECVPAFDVGRGVIGGGMPKEIFDVALMRLRQPDVARPELLCVFNPPSKRHWCYTSFVGPSLTEAGRAELAARDYAFFDQPPFENEKNLPAGYYDHLIRTLSPELADRFVYGKPITVYPGMPVYPHILEDVHVVERVARLPDVGLVTGHDFGRTPAALISQVTKQGQIRFLKEIQLWGASTETMCQVLERTLRDEFRDMEWLRGWGDPSGQNPTETNDKTSFGIMAAKGWPIMAGAETLAHRTEAVKQRAARMVEREPALLIDATGCPMLAEALLGGYRYPKSGDGQIGYAPLKNDYSHIANAFEYTVSGEFSPYTGERLQDDPRRERGRLIPRYSPLDSPPASPGGSWLSS